MANFDFHTATTQQAQALIAHSDLNCYVNYLHQFVLEDNSIYNCNFIFRYGMPAQFPEGKGGMTVGGDVGVTRRPIVVKGDGRAAPRHREMQEYHIEFGSLIRIVAPITDYYELHAQQMANPTKVIKAHLAALSRAIPNYHKYLVYKIFAGEKFKAKNTIIKDGFEKYIEPSDGDQNGYIFELHQAHGEINLKKIITPEDKKSNELKKRLDAINKALRNDTRKVEVKVAEDEICQTDGIKKNLTNSARKTLALFHKACELADDVIRDGQFDPKYMHKDDQGAAKFKNAKGEAIDWEKGRTPVSNGSQIIILFNDKAGTKLTGNYRMSNPVTEFIGKNATRARFVTTDMVDEDEVLILHEDLIQIHVLPLTVRYQSYDYSLLVEQTRDYYHAFDHSLDLIPVYSNIYLKLAGG